MFALRRAATRALCAPSTAILSKPRPLSTFTPVTFRPRQQKWVAPAFQRRFLSEDATEFKEKIVEEKAVESTSDTQSSKVEEVEDSTSDPSAKPTTPEPAAAAPEEAQSGAEALGAAAGHAVQSDAGRSSARSGPFAMPPPEPNTTLYVGNLFFEVKEDQLDRIFSRFGVLEDVNIVKDNQGRSRGFGYVKFQNLADATAALENLDMQVFEGRHLVVQYHKARNTNRSVNRHESAPSPVLFIGNMSFQMTDKDLNDMFKDIRNVKDVRVAIDRRTGQPRGFAHADFVDVASATQAREILSRKSYYGRELRVDYGRTTRQTNRERDNGTAETQNITNESINTEGSN